MRVSKWDINDGPDVKQSTEALLSPAAEPVLDLAIFGAFRDVLDPKTLAGIYRDFLLQTGARVAALPRLQDREELSGLAHTLKGTAGMLGANRVAARAAQLERELAAGPDLALAAQQLAEACTALRAALIQAQVAL